MTRDTALILGASGQDGTLIAQQLSSEGVAVHATGRRLGEQLPQSWRPFDLDTMVHRHTLDPRDFDRVRSLIDHVRPTQLFCLAGQSSVGRSFDEPLATYQSHILPLLNAAEAIRQLGLATHIVFAGSGEMFGETSQDAPATETSIMAPRSPYAAAKAMAVTLAKSYRSDFGTRISVAYLFGHESPLRSDAFVFGKVLGAIWAVLANGSEANGSGTGGSGQITLGDGEIIRDWGWAPDYAAAMIAMARLNDPIDLILATGTSVSLKQAVEALFEAAGLDASNHVTFGDPAMVRPHESRQMFAYPAKARQVIGWTDSRAFPELAELLLRPMSG